MFCCSGKACPAGLALVHYVAVHARFQFKPNRFVVGLCWQTFRWMDEMSHNNPYDSASEQTFPSVDPLVLRAIAAKLADARQNPPTVMRALSKWPGTPLLVLIGVAGTTVLAFLAASGDSAITSHWPWGFAAMTFGAFLRDLGLARRVKKLWAPQSHFIDWAKVDELTSSRWPT